MSTRTQAHGHCYSAGTDCACLVRGALFIGVQCALQCVVAGPIGSVPILRLGCSRLVQHGVHLQCVLVGVQCVSVSSDVFGSSAFHVLIFAMCALAHKPQ